MRCLAYRRRFLRAFRSSAGRDEREGRPGVHSRRRTLLGSLLEIRWKAGSALTARREQAAKRVGGSAPGTVRQQRSEGPGRTPASGIARSGGCSRPTDPCSPQPPLIEIRADYRVAATFPRTGVQAGGRRSRVHRRLCSSRQNGVIRAGCNSRGPDGRGIRACNRRR